MKINFTYYSVILILLIFCSLKPCAQEIAQISGTVTEGDTEKPLAGVTIMVKNKTAGTTSDIDGHFKLAVNRNETLIFSFIGYTTVQKLVSGNVINVKMQAQLGSLNDVVVVGYGSSSKTNLASSISTVSAKDFKNAIITNLDQALQGRVSGVQVTAVSGEPGADAVIRIRGNNSLSGDNQPLYVVDGFPMPPYTEASSIAGNSMQQNGLYGINPNDIESIDVLKDASATAIYGSRGANGVILIKTKSGKKGTSKIEFVNKTSFGKINNPYKMSTAPELAKLINTAFAFDGIPAPFSDAAIAGLSTGTDWFKAITQNSLREDATVNVSGGGEKTTYYISGNYLSDKGNVLAAKNSRASVKANISSQVTDWYSVQAQLSLTRQKTNRSISDSRSFPGGDGPILDALRASPLVAVDYLGFNSVGIPGFTDGNYFSNPVATLLQKTDQTLNDFSIVNFENSFKITKDLQFNVNLGSNQNLSRRQLFFPLTTAQGYGANGTGSNNAANTYSYNVNAYLNYNKDINKDNVLGVTAGVEYNKQSLEELNTSSSGYDIPAFGVTNIGSANNQSIGSFKSERVIESAFLRANYSFRKRYVLNTSIRVDGASPFAENKKYGIFPAVGFAWNLNEESFMKEVAWITNSKFRASFGETGSQAISSYSSLSQYSNGFYQTGAGAINTVLFPTRLGNPNLSWERTKQFDAGLDFSLFKSLLNINIDYYRKTTEGLLQNQQLPSQSGYGSVISNYGSMRNTGIELTLGANLIKNSTFQYNTKIFITHNKNTLLNLGEITAPQYVGIAGNLTGGVSGVLEPGGEIGRFYGYRVTGLVQTGDIVNGVPSYPFAGSASNQAAGQWKYCDVNGNGVIDAEDRVVLGKANPLFTYGWNNDFTFKKIGLNLFFTGSQGNEILNLTQTYLSSGLVNYSGVFFNQTKDWYDHRWTESNPTNNPKYPGVQKSGSALSDINSAMVQNGSYFRLKSATLTYNLPDSKAFKNARIFFTGTNLWTITKYTGSDPEVSSFGQSLLQQGIDFGAYPSSRTYTIGVSSNF